MKQVGPCIVCRCDFVIPDVLYEAAKRGAGVITFYCPYGHGQVFAKGEDQETLLRRERDRLKQENARLEQERIETAAIADAERERAVKAEGKVKRLTKRVAAGTCPCCKRTFSNMATHMRRQHPEFVAETGANVVPIKAGTAA